jgi:hypothetical protein
MPGIIGYNTIGSNTALTESNWSTEVYCANPYTAVSDDTITEIAAYNGGTGSGTAIVGIYEFSGGVPTTRVATQNVTMTGSVGWKTQAVSIALTPGTVYVIGYQYCGGAAAAGWTIAYDTSVGDTSIGDPCEAFPTTWSENSTSTDDTSLYATVSGPAYELEQEGFRFRNDNGSETTATWIEVQDTDATIPLDTPFRFRGLIATTDDAPSTQFRVDYKSSTEAASEWRAVGVGATSYGSTPTVVGFGSAALTTNDPSVNLSSGSWTPAEDDVVVFFMASTTTLDVPVNASLPSGWVNCLADGAEQNSDAHGYGAIYHLVTAGEAGGSTTFTATNALAAAETGNVIGVALRGVDPTTPIHKAASGFDNANTGTPDTLAALTGANQPTVSGCLVVRGLCQDSTATFSGPAGHTSVTSFNTNQGHEVFTRDAATTAGADVAATSVTPDAGDEDCSITIAFLPAVIIGTPAITFTTSTNFADGDATTAQLTAPASGSFVAGVMVEGQALADTVDITADNYTEIEWALVAQDPAVADDVYNLRITANGTAFDTYSVTPDLTIGAGGIDETGRTVDIAATVTSTDQADWEQLGLAVDITATVTSTDQLTAGGTGFDETGRLLDITATVTGTDQADWEQLGLVVTIAATVTSTDQADWEQLGLAVDIVAVITVVDSTVLYPVSISGRKVLDQNGDVFLGFYMSSWAICTNLSDADITTAVEACAANGFTGMVAWIGGGFTTDSLVHPEYENDAGQDFWTGTPWQSSLGAAWASIDHFVQECAANGLVAVLSLGFGFDTSGAGPDIEAASDAEMEDVGEAVATRYLAYPNIQWHVLLDDGDSTSSTRGDRTMAFFTGVANIESTARPVRWMEVANGATTSEQGWYQAGSFNCTINSIYEYGSSSVELFEAEYAEETGPVGDCEPPYVGSGHYSGNEDQQLRERNYAVFIEGGCLINFGHEDWWPFGGDGIFTDGETWDTVQTDVEVVEASHAWGLIGTYCKDTTWAPVSTFVTTGQGSGDTKAAQGASGTAALAYFPSDRTVQVDTTILTGTSNVRLRWYDPIDGTYSTIAASEAQQTGRSVTLPAAHGDGTRDFVLVVDLVGGTSYDETGRAVDIVATVTSTDQADWEELNRSVDVTATVTSTDSVDLEESGLTVDITAAVTSTDQADLEDLARPVDITATITSTDQLAGAIDETGRQVDITAAVTSTDQADLEESSRAVDIAATVTSTDQADYDETGRAVDIVATITSTDETAGAFNELGRPVDITATVTVTDRADLEDHPLDITATATVTSTDGRGFDETGRQATLNATVDVVDAWSGIEVPEMSILATVTHAELAALTDAVLLGMLATFTVSEGFPPDLHPIHLGHTESRTLAHRERAVRLVHREHP